MRKLLLAVMAVAGCLVFAGPAMAWTYNDCVKVNFDHPDCDKYEKPPVTPPVTPPVVPPVTPPVAPPVVPPVTPPAPPAAPEEEAPPVEYEVIIDVPASPDLPKKNNKGQKGKTERRHDSIVPPAPKVQTRVDTYRAADTLPYTGIPATLLLLAGAGLVSTGMVLRRRTRHQ